MIKSILLSVRPEHAVKILNGEKTAELRKSLPKDIDKIIKKEGGIWVYIYVTKAKPFLINIDILNEFYNVRNNYQGGDLEILNGKVVARFWFDEYDKYYFNAYQGDYRLVPKNRELLTNATMPLSELCLTLKEVETYGKEKELFVWHIKKLEIFDKPKELSDFHYYKTKTVYCGMDCPPYVDEVKQTLRKAPQSWQYVWEKV